MKIVMTLKVRDEEDILADNLRFHIAQGVDFFVVTDNGSTDSTPEILERYQRAGLAQVTHEPSEDFHELGQEWVTRMAREAATEHDADWVVHGDADEFWWPLRGTLRDVLDSVPPEYGALVGARAEFVPRPPGEGSWSEQLDVRQRRALLRPKVAHRGEPNAIVLHRGGHDVAFVESGQDLRSALRPPGRAVLRGVRPEEGSGGGLPVPAPIYSVRILHFPVRSLEQFSGRVEAALLRDPGRGPRVRLRERYEVEGVEGLYAELCFDDAAVERGIEEGSLVRDTRLRDFLPLCPDPLAGAPGPSPDPPELPAEMLDREQRELELDAMEALTRHTRLTEVRVEQLRLRAQELVAERGRLLKERQKAERRRNRIRKLQRKLERQGEALRRERMRPGSRARRAVRRALGRDRRSK